MATTALLGLAACTLSEAPRHPRPALPASPSVAAAPLECPKLVRLERHAPARWRGALQGDGEVVTFELWSERERCYDRDQKARPLVLLVPMLAGGAALMDFVGDSMYSRGFDVALCNRAGSAMKPGQRGAELQELFRRTVLHQRLMLTWLRRDRDQPQFVLGISLGGMVATAVAAQEPAVAGTAICLSGGHLESLIPASREPRVQRWVEWRQQVDGVGLDHVRWELREVLQYEPMALASAVPTAKVLFVSATLDDVVPPRNQDLLWEALGRPSRLFVPFGHYTAALAIAPILSAAASHFRARTG
ncbi:MAG: lysophospholipase [bacterium]|nr:lysophospholipase [bacterium]